MIFSLYSKVVIKVGGEERHVFDHAELMISEVQLIEKCTGMSWGEWQLELHRYSSAAVLSLLHALRLRDGMASEWPLELKAAQLDVVPLKDDGSEYTAGEVAADVARRMAEAGEAAAGNGSSPAAGGKKKAAGRPAKNGRARAAGAEAT